MPDPTFTLAAIRPHATALERAVHRHGSNSARCKAWSGAIVAGALIFVTRKKGGEKGGKRDRQIVVEKNGQKGAEWRDEVMRTARLKAAPGFPAAHYHCISRVVEWRFAFGEEEKEHFAELMRRYERFCGVQVVTFCVMSNHFHILDEIGVRK